MWELPSQFKVSVENKEEKFGEKKAGVWHERKECRIRDSSKFAKIFRFFFQRKSLIFLYNKQMFKRLILTGTRWTVSFESSKKSTVLCKNDYFSTEIVL